MAKIPKNFRFDPEVLIMLDKLIQTEKELKLTQTAMIEYLVRKEYYSLGLPQLPNDSEQ